MTPTDVQVERVLVPIDGSEFALQALPTARALADRFGAEVHTISVATAEGSTERLRALAAAVLGVADRDTRVYVKTDSAPADAITRRAAELDPCVVCLTTHGRGRLHGALVGSVARSVLQRSSGPIVALGPVADNPGWSPRPRSWPEPLSVARMVACVDGSEPSEQILPTAASWARTLAMSLTILTVVDDSPEPLWPEARRSRYGAASPETYIESLVDRWRDVVSNIDGEVVRDPLGPARGIWAHLDQRPAGLVAVTTHARSGMHRAVVGATAASIVHASVAPCLVATVVH